MIEAKNLCKTYRAGDQTLAAAARGSINVANGEMVAVVGHSGSGKTTLLSLLGGLSRPDSGQVLLDGVDICSLYYAGLSDLRNRKLGFIYQFSSLIPTLSVMDKVCLPIAFGPGLDNLTGRAKELLALVGLGDGGFLLAQLSGSSNDRWLLPGPLSANRW